MPSRFRMSNRIDRVRPARVHDQVAGLLGRPGSVRVLGYPEDVHSPGRYLHDKQHVQALEEDRVHREEVTRQQTCRLDAEEPALGGVQAARSRPVPAGAEDPLHSRLADMVAKPGELAVHPPVSPGRVLFRQPQHQVADVRTGPGAARPVRVSPLAGDQTAVPGQQGSRRNQPTVPQRGWQQLGERRKDRPVGPV